MFLTRGFIFTYEAVREWEAKLTPALTEHLRRKRRVWARLRELFPGCQPRRPQSDAADDQGVAPATEERQEHGRSVGYVRSDPEGLATVLWPVSWVGAQASVAQHESVPDPMVDA